MPGRTSRAKQPPARGGAQESHSRAGASDRLSKRDIVILALVGLAILGLIALMLASITTSYA
jgi:hypothetical protein